MSQGPNREQALGLLEEHHSQIEAVIAGVDEARLDQPGTVAGGWSIAQLLAHIEAWERLAVWTIEDWQAKRYPRIHEMYAAAGGVDPLNDQLLAERSGWDATESVRRFADTYRELSGMVRAMEDVEWFQVPFYEPPVPTIDLADAVGRVLGSEEGLFLHAAAHIYDLREALARGEA